jgi:desulfoferrodoxin-like iron-binding protein
MCCVVNVQKAGEVYRCNICGNVVLVNEAGGGELVCHGEPMMLVEVQENQTG